MKFMNSLRIIVPAVLIICSVKSTAQVEKWTVTSLDEKIRIITNTGGQTLGYSTASGVKILSVDGFAFKDLNKNVLNIFNKVCPAIIFAKIRIAKLNTREK